MTPATQPNLIDNLMNGYSCIFYPMCHIARELSYCPKKVGKRDCEDYRSRPYTSTGALQTLFDKVNQRQMDVETEEGDIIEVIEKGEVLAWIDELRTEAHK